MMITIKDYMETINYRITEGDQYLWTCYGYNSYSLDSWNGDNTEGYNIGIVFDTQTQTVYEMSACDYKNQRAYRWIHPEYREKYQKESKDRDANPNEAWDDVNFIDLEVEDDILEKSRAIVSGEEYDTRVIIPLEFSDAELLTYMKMAHERDLSFNDFIEEILRTAINEFKNSLSNTKQ